MHLILLFPPSSKLSGVSEETYEEVKKMDTTPVSYLVQQPSVFLPVGEEMYPMGCGLGYQVHCLNANG